eukprot:gene16994-22491_t
MHNHMNSDYISLKESNKETSTGRWTAEEHKLFLEGLRIHRKQWKQIADLIKTRTVVQIRTHAQKYFQKLSKSSMKPDDLFDDLGVDADNKNIYDDLMEEKRLKAQRLRSDSAASPKSKRQKTNNSTKVTYPTNPSFLAVEPVENDWFVDNLHNPAPDDFSGISYESGLGNLEDVDFLWLANTVGQSITSNCQCSQLCKHISLNNSKYSTTEIDSPRSRDNSIATTNESVDDVSSYDQPFKYSLSGAMDSIESDMSRFDTEEFTDDMKTYEKQNSILRKRGRNRDNAVDHSETSTVISNWEDDETFGGFLEIFA